MREEKGEEEGRRRRRREEGRGEDGGRWKKRAGRGVKVKQRKREVEKVFILRRKKGRRKEYNIMYRERTLGITNVLCTYEHDT